MAKRTKTSLVTNTLLLIVIPVIALFGVYNFFAYKQVYHTTEEKYMDKIGLLTFQCATQINNELYGISNLLNSTIDELDLNEKKSLDEVREKLKKALLSNQYVYGIDITLNNDYYNIGQENLFLYEYKPSDFSREGKVKEIIINDENYNTYPYHNKQWWRYTAENLESRWTVPYYDKGLGNVYMISYTTPLFINGKYAGVAGIDVNITELKNIVTYASIRAKETFERAQIFILSSDSTIVFDKRIKLIGKKISAFESDSSLNELIDKLYETFTTFYGISEFEYKNDRLIISYAPIPQANWVVSSVLKKEQIEETINRSILPKVFVSLLFIILLIIIVYILAQKIARPIGRLCDVSIQVARGNYNVNIDIDRKDELGMLANNFMTMKDHLQKREQNLMESAAKMRQLLDNIPLAVFQFNGQHKLVYLNQIGKEVLELKKDEQALHDFTGWVSLLNNPGDKNKVEKAYQGEMVVIEGDNLFNSDYSSWFKNRYVQIHIIPYLKDGKLDSITLIIFDLTAVKQAENLRVEKKSAEMANKTKGEFLARMSHEIRTPLNAVIGFSNLALAKYPETDQYFDYFKKINSAAKHLLVIVNDILDYSKIEAGKMELEEIPFDIDLLLMDISDLTMDRAHKKDIEFIISHSPLIPVPLIGDPYKLKQILVNLVGNAIKFTENGEIHVDVDIESQNKHSVRLLFSIKDTGIGMSEDHINKLFQPFVQGDGSITRRFGGTGIGLAISKRLVELMKGKIWVESKDGVGTTFYFTAEFKTESKVSSIQEYIKKFKFDDDIRGLKILACDDNKTTRLLLDTMLTSLSFKVSTASSGTEVIKYLEHGGQCDILIIDRVMPSPDGVETVKIINERGFRKNIKRIILLSAYEKNIDQDELSALNIDLFMKKPFNYSNMFDAIMTVNGKVDKSMLKNKAKRKEQLVFVKIPDKKVLVVDDNELNRDLAGDMFTTMGLKVDFAENGQVAVDKVVAQKSKRIYAIVFMDLQMPVMDGYEATRIIRSDSDFNNLPIVAMSADVLEGVKEKCLKAGMNDFVPKPVDPAKVVEVISKWVDKVKIVKKDLKGDRKELSGDLYGFEHVNVPEGLRRIGNNEEKYINLLIKFYHNNLDIINRWKELDSIQDKLKLIHAFKGVTGNIGANKLYDLVVKFENSMKNNNMNEELFLQVILEFENVLAEIAPLAKKQENIEKKTISGDNRQSINDSLKRIELMLLDGNPDVQKELDLIAPYFTSDKAFEEVARLVSMYRFEDAALELKKVRV